MPDHLFDRDSILKAQEEQKKTLVLPTRTFWRPVYFEPQPYPDIMNLKFAKRLRQYGKGEQGVLVSALRPFSVKRIEEYIKLDRFFFKSDYEEDKQVEKLKTDIQLSMQRAVADPGVRF